LREEPHVVDELRSTAWELVVREDADQLKAIQEARVSDEFTL